MPGVNITGRPSTRNHYLGRGALELAELSVVTGKPLGFRHVGNVTAFSLNLETERLEHQSSRSGIRAIDREIILSQKIGVTITMDEILDFENLALFLSGTASREVANPATNAAIADQLIASDLVKGRTYDLVNSTGGRLYDLSPSLVPASFKAHATTLGSAVTLTASDVEIDLVWGTVFVKGNAPNVPAGGRLWFSYTGATTEKPVDVVNMLTKTKQSAFLRFRGINPADNDRRVLVDLHSVSLSSDGELPWIGEEFATMTLSGVAERNELGFPTAPTGRVIWHEDA